MAANDCQNVKKPWNIKIKTKKRAKRRETEGEGKQSTGERRGKGS